LQQLFASFDEHHKGFITLKDWDRNLEPFFTGHEEFEEFKRFIKNNFNSIEEAFIHLSEKREFLKQGDFCQKISQLMRPKLA
jgi:hypothetical protein